MKLTAALFSILLLFVGCRSSQVEVERVVRDTIYLADTTYLRDVDTVRVLTSKCIENEIRLMNIRHYVKITESNPKNKVFFWGWIKRAVEE